MSQLDLTEIKRRLYAYTSSIARRTPNACWNWQGACTGRNKDRGYVTLWADGIATKEYAYRLSYLVHIGEIPQGLIIMHSCDNPRCINPKHLLAGTQSQNTQDAWDRGLQPHKYLHHAKLSQDDLKSICNRANAPAQLMATYNLTQYQIKHLRRAHPELASPIDKLPNPCDNITWNADSRPSKSTVTRLKQRAAAHAEWLRNNGAK